MTAGAAGTGSRVLIVEDSATQAAALAMVLERAGYVTMVARRADRALELLEREPIDLVLSDVVMPGMDGYELCRNIKTRPEWARMPVVLLTSLTDPLAIVRGLASGADHYITKPYDLDGLLARVRFVLQRALDPHLIHPAPVDVELLGTTFTIRATKEQILELLVSSYSDLVRTSEVVREAEQRARFLAEATETLSATLDARKVLSDLARLSVPRIADLCATDLIGKEGARHRVALAHALPGVGPLVGRETAAQTAMIEQVALALEPRVIDIPDAAALAALTSDAEVLAALGGRGALALIVLPLVARGRVLGIVQFVMSQAARAARPDDMPFVMDLARRAGLALDNALLYEEAQRATRRANALIQDLLDVSRIDAGTLAVATTAIEGSMLIRDAVLELDPLVSGKKLVFEHDWTGPDILLAADRSRIGQVFSNLVGNAIKFTPAGGTVRIEGRSRGDAAEFDVIDTGNGIPPEHLPHLFDRFWQASQTSRTGAGLGLFIVKGIVDAHGGQIHVESVAGTGTRFRFTIPTAVRHGRATPVASGTIAP